MIIVIIRIQLNSFIALYILVILKPDTYYVRVKLPESLVQRSKYTSGRR